ncbi:MAG: hypothetical protein J7M38_08565 [Armatimonadetes bacterium]|nr:hypothetical protein [Armatimonadota bacterium]
MADRWLQLGDRLILDGADHSVVEVVIGRTDRINVQVVRAVPDLGGEARWLLQIEDEAVRQAEEVAAEVLNGPEVVVGEERFRRQWRSEARTERAAVGERVHFGRGECELYRAESGAAAVRLSDQRGVSAFAGRPLDPAQIDLRFTGS